MDFRKLNAMVLKDVFPIPVIDDVLLKLQAARWFSVMDLKNGFFHVSIKEESRKYTAFIASKGLFELIRQQMCVNPQRLTAVKNRNSLRSIARSVIPNRPPFCCKSARCKA